jgi:hypothetical protein
MKRILLSLTLLSMAACSEAIAGDIVLTFEIADKAWWGCNVTIPCECRARMFVWARLSGESAGGITGVEYRIEVGDVREDPGWVFIETFNSGLTILGTGALNPGDSNPRGIVAAWSSCQTGEFGQILLETVDIFNMGCDTTEKRLRVARADPASNPFYQCPLFVLCDGPVFTKVCVGSPVTMCMNPQPPFPNNAFCSTSGTAELNPVDSSECFQSPEGAAECIIAVQPESWSRVKALYRD